MSTGGEQEQRACARINEENGIAIRFLDADGTPVTRGDGTYLRLTRNVSESGMCFTHSEPIPQGTLLKVHLALDLPRKIVSQVGHVRWCEHTADDEPYQVGVRFADSEEGADRQLWRHYVASRTASRS